ncbi:MAG: YeeE/YedE thiosulfate transporter family protein [Spirochaetaceae bacterium]
MSDTATPALQGETGSIRRSSSRSKKKKKNQLPLGVLSLIIIVALGVVLGVQSSNLAFFWFTGTIFGFILQRARICFTASMRDPYLTGGTSLTKAILLALAVTSIGFWAIQYGASSRGLPIPGQSFVVPISLSTVVGGVVFGIGMVISGGCASGTLMRVGEGFTMQMLSIFFFVVGSLIGAAHFGWWTENVILHGKAVFLPDVLGWFGSIVVQLLTIALLWIAADKFAKAKQGASAH